MSAETYDVTLRWDGGPTETLSVARDETVLDATERDGLGVPFGCLYGACGTCTGRLVEGSVEHVDAPRALKPRQLEAGYVLLCLAQPRSACHIVVGAQVQAELVPNPWK